MIQIDMEKPNHCLHCPMCNGDDDCVLIQEIDTSWDWEEQYANCPLQEVKPKQKKGKWIKIPEFCGDDVSGFIDNHFSCSECKKEAEINPWGFYILSDFCPNCGADMRGEQDDDK